MNIEFHILLGKPRGKETLEVIATATSRGKIVEARAKVQASKFSLMGEINTNGTSLKNVHYFPTPEAIVPTDVDEED